MPRTPFSFASFFSACFSLILFIGTFFLVPTLLVWLAWNAFVHEMFSGPMIQYFQAFLLWIALGLIAFAILQPQIEVVRLDSLDETGLDDLMRSEGSVPPLDASKLPKHWQEWRQKFLEKSSKKK
jgi:hypothetical protein